MTKWLVTGGAGYIGAHVVRALQASGREVVVLDDLSSGFASKIPTGVLFVEGSVHNRETLAHALTGCDGVVHLAAKKAAGESVMMPLYYFRENVGGMLNLLETMQEVGVKRLVYSSSAAVYGTPTSNPVSETAPLLPDSPYGETKVVGEQLARDCGVAHEFSWVALRYFNVAGAGSDQLGDPSINNLVPMVFRALEQGKRPQVFGDDYPTPDGTCIRDYIHVEDLARAHVAAAIRAEENRAADVFNVGRGVGSSVHEVMNAISEAIGRDVEAEVVSRRVGDPAATFADTRRINAELGWTATRDLSDMVTSAWSAWVATHGVPPAR